MGTQSKKEKTIAFRSTYVNVIMTSWTNPSRRARNSNKPEFNKKRGRRAFCTRAEGKNTDQPGPAGRKSSRKLIEGLWRGRGYSILKQDVSENSSA